MPIKRTSYIKVDAEMSEVLRHSFLDGFKVMSKMLSKTRPDWTERQRIRLVAITAMEVAISAIAHEQNLSDEMREAFRDNVLDAINRVLDVQGFTED